MQKNGADLNDLHSCWAGVFQQLLARGRAEPVLAALDAAAAREDRHPQLLMTQQEALHLTEQAQKQGLQGTDILICNLAAGQTVWSRRAPCWQTDYSNEAEAHHNIHAHMRVHRWGMR